MFTTPVIVGLAGSKQSGKSTVARILCDQYGFVEVSLAAPLKAMAYAIDPIVGVDSHGEPLFLQSLVDKYGWDYTKTTYPHARRFLQRLGTEGARAGLGEDTWVNILEGRVRALYQTYHTRFVVPDVRFPNEAEWVEAWGGYVVRVVNDKADAVADGHPSETALANYPFENYIDNNGTLEALRWQVAEFATGLHIPIARY